MARGFLRTFDRWPRRRTYPAAGFVLALGAPLGYLGLRCALARRAPSPSWVVSEVQSELVTYLYLTVATSIVLVLLGRALGKMDDLLRASSLADGLTGLANRRHLHARLDDELARAARHGTALSLLLIDVDDLKAWNDKGGHRVGDEVLRAVAESLKRACRRTDLAARYGGDEFALVAPSTTGEDALVLAERIRATLARSAVRGLEAPTVSIGVADLDRSGATSPEALCAAADRALYRAKAEGKDRAVLAERSPSLGASAGS